MRNRDFELAPALERQMQLWNQWMDANRSLWALWAPWLQMTPWFLNAAAGNDVEHIEKEAIVDGLPDTLELQARSWNHFLDTQKQFWTVFGWPVGDMVGMNGGRPAAEHDAEETEAQAGNGSEADRKPRARARRH